MDYREKSFWLETAGAYEERPPLAGDHVADVCIIGGGFTGISAALHLKEREPGLRVVVLESAVVGYGASGRNAGFSMTLFGLSPEVTRWRFGLQGLREADAYMVRAVAEVRRRVAEHGIDCDYEENGLLTVAASDAQRRRLQREMELARRAGAHETTWLEAEAVRDLVNSPAFCGARLDPVCAILNPARLVRGLARAAEEAGAVICERTPALEVEPGPRVRIRTAHGQVVAEKAILATNAYSHQFRPVRSRQLPVHTYIVLTEPLSPAQLEAIGWRRRQGIEDGRNLIHYFRLTADNRLLMGGEDAHYYWGSAVGRDRNPVLQQRLQEAVKRTFPALAGVRFTHHWGGPISATLDLAPAIGRIGSNLLYSVGCMGHGVSLCTLNGATLADLALERQTDLTDVFFVNRRMLPVPPEPLRFVVAGAILAGMRLGDRWDERRR
ncbi:NAD(P)/FAD-dependent oxidoreductase [Symbiobacterium terraclitae]|uniref:NAD(P)/FAD-dependent oxidoreductase n=1 Tax=Symbiobacterium terraclitae TaxID=557451 RepID=UPI0035B54082